MPHPRLFSVFDVSRQVFFESASSLGIVNLKPLRPGHVLIISKRVVPRLADLEPREVSDLFLSVQRVGRVIERAYDAEALNVSLQDGIAAGQSVPHVHVHIIPRLRTDFGGEPDKVYPALERHERDLQSDMRRSDELERGVEGVGSSGVLNGTSGAKVLSAVTNGKPAPDANGGTDSPPTPDRNLDLDDALRERERACRRTIEGWQVPRDEDRKPRSMDEMEKEASWLAGLLGEAGVRGSEVAN